MSFTVKIVDNETNKVLIDEPHARAIIGAADTPNYTHGMCFVRCNIESLMHALNTAEEAISKLEAEVPGVDLLRKAFKGLKKMKQEEEADDE